MATKNPKRANRGGQLLSRVDDSIREIAGHMGVSPTTAGYWRTGERKPNFDDRDRLKDRYGIPVEAWDEPPVAIGRPKSATAEIPERPHQEERDDADDDDDEEEDDEEDTGNHDRLRRFIRDGIRELELDTELSGVKRAEALKKLVDAQVALDKSTGENALTLARIVAHPEFKRVVQKITEGIAVCPTCLRRAIEVLEAAAG